MSTEITNQEMKEIVGLLDLLNKWNSESVHTSLGTAYVYDVNGEPLGEVAFSTGDEYVFKVETA